MATRLRLNRPPGRQPLRRAGASGRLAWADAAEHAWALVALWLALGALAGRTATLPAGGWLPDRAWDEPWRWWSAAFVHLSDGHLAANVVGCAVVGAFGQFGARAVDAAPTGAASAGAATPGAAVAGHWALAWLAAWPLTHGLLLAEPRLAGYAGLSGVLHAGVAVAALGLVVQGRGLARAIGAAVMAGLVVKLVLEQPWRAPVRTLAQWDVPVAVAAHASGAVAGLACAAVLLLARRHATMRASRPRTGHTDPP